MEGATAQNQENVAWITAIMKDEANLEELFSCPKPTIEPVSRTEIRRLQQEDENIGTVLRWKLQGQRPPRRVRQRQTPEVRALLREWNRLSINEDGILWRKTASKKQIVLPVALRELALRELHCEMGHLGAGAF